MDHNTVVWQMTSEDREEAIVLLYQKLAQPNPTSDLLRVKGLKERMIYDIKTRSQYISIKEFGSLVNHVTPISITAGGVVQSVVDKIFMLNSEQEHYVTTGSLLENAGVKLTQKFAGVGYSERVRIMGDFSSRLYYVKRKESNKEVE